VYRDNVENEADDDVLLDEFADEIESWIIDELKKIGCDSAKNVLELSEEDLLKRTDLEEETIKEVRNIFKSEFE
jgi:N utilization substance protein A